MKAHTEKIKSLVDQFLAAFNTPADRSMYFDHFCLIFFTLLLVYYCTCGGINICRGRVTHGNAATPVRLCDRCNGEGVIKLGYLNCRCRGWGCSLCLKQCYTCGGNETLDY